MGADRPKQFLDLDGKPVLRRTVECFLDFDPSIELILVLPSDEKAWWRDYCRQTRFIERFTMVSGGITRFHSVQNALRYVGDDDVVAIHDGVRPLLRRSLLERLFAAVEEFPAVIPAVPVVESVRKAADEEGLVSERVDRTGLMLVQTPQVFRADTLKAAYRQPFSPSFTDDASVVEASGGRVKIISGDRINIKITTPEDMEFASGLIRAFSCGQDS